MARRSGSFWVKVIAGWVLLALAAWLGVYSVFFHTGFDKPFAAMAMFVFIFAGAGGALVLWSD